MKLFSLKYFLYHSIIIYVQEFRVHVEIYGYRKNLHQEQSWSLSMIEQIYSTTTRCGNFISDNDRKEIPTIRCGCYGLPMWRCG